MKSLLLFLVLGLAGCYSPGEETDMGGNAQFAKSGGWSSSFTLKNDGKSNGGGAVDFLAGRDSNQIPSKNYTVQFSVGQPKDSTGKITTDRINPVAEISWSVEGNTVRRVVSVTNGAAVTGVGQAVKIVVRDQTFQQIATTVSYDVSITVAPGTRPSENQPATFNPTLATQTSTIDVAPGGIPTGVIVPIPVNAGVISAFITVVPNDNSAIPENSAMVIGLDAANVITRKYDPTNAGFVPILAQTVQLLLVNNLPAGPGVPTLNYAVTFGIDG